MPHRLLVLLAFLVPTLALAAPADPGAEVRMSLDHYARLMAKAQAQSVGRVSWGRGGVDVRTTAGLGHVEVTVTARLDYQGETAGEVPLLPAEVVLTGVELNGQEATLGRAAGAHTVYLEKGTKTTIRLRYVVPIRGADGAAALVPLPPLPGAKLTISGPGPHQAWPSENLKVQGAQTVAALPATSAVLIRFGEAPGGTVRRVDYILTPDAVGDGVDVEARFEVFVTGPKATVRLAETESALLSLERAAGPLRGPLRGLVRDGWHYVVLEGAGRHLVVAKLRLMVDRSQGQPKVRLNPNNAPMASVTITVPGKRAITFEPPVPPRTVVKGEGERAMTTAVAHLPPTDEVLVRWTEARAAPEQSVRVNTETYQMLTLQEGVLRGVVHLRYDVIHGETRELAVALPADVVPYKVEGLPIQDWRIFPATDDAPRQLRVVLGEPLTGKANLTLHLETRVEPKAGTPITLPIVRPLGAFREVGVVALLDGEKVGFAPARSQGYAMVGEDALPSDIRQGLRDKVNQAFKHIGAPGEITTAVASAKARDVRFDVRINTLYLVREGTLTGQSSVLVEVKSGRRNKVVISLPEGLAEPRITAPSLNKVEPLVDFDAGEGRKAYEVRFTRALEGAVEIDVTFERILDKALGEIPLPDVRVHGAEVSSGSIGVAAETGMELKPGAPGDLRRVTAAELPRAITGRSELEVQLGYTYARGPWALTLDIKRHHTVETLDALGVHVWLETNVLENGHIVSLATYEVENGDRQYLRLTLPAEAEVLRVTAAGQKVKAVKDDTGAIAIPLPKHQTSRVEVQYEVRRDALGKLGSVDLLAPSADLRTRDVQWLLRMPDGLNLFSVDTQLKAQDPDEWRGTGHEVGMPIDGEVTMFLFSYAVHDPSEAPLTLSFRYAASLGQGAWLLLVCAIFGLVFLVVRRRVRRRAEG